MQIKSYNEILDFWFEELEPADWFKSDSALDRSIEKRFGETLKKASKGELYKWRESIKGRLAEIILLDQFSRNIYRGRKGAFDLDNMALVLAQEAVKDENADTLSDIELSFLYMPFMHSESLKIQEEFSMKLFTKKGLEKRYRYAKEHYQTIKKFGRFPYRNKVLNRKSTVEELNYLKE